MISNAVMSSRPGPLERTRFELLSLERRAAFRRSRLSDAELRRREADAVLDLIESCRLQGFDVVPTAVWSATVQLAGAVSGALRDEVGIDRHPDHLQEIVFAVQEELQKDLRERRRPQLAPIIPLFPLADNGSTRESFV